MRSASETESAESRWSNSTSIVDGTGRQWMEIDVGDDWLLTAESGTINEFNSTKRRLKRGLDEEMQLPAQSGLRWRR